MKNKNGFSLVEVIIAITIIGVIGAVSSTILSRTYRVNTQSDSISKLKSNGTMAVSMISDLIRNSEGVVCYSPSVPRKSIAVRTLDGKYTKFTFVDPTPPDGTITQNGYIIKQENLNPTDFSNFCSTDLASPTKIVITNKDTVSGVSISDGEFIMVTGSGGKDLVTIKFNVNPTLTSRGSLSSTIFPVQTTVQVR